MILRHLCLVNYKNIAQAELDLAPGINCFIGNNGEGKTNVLDAVYFLSMCKSGSTNVDRNVVRHGQEFLMLQAQYEREDGTPEEIHCGMKLGQKKVFRRGGKAYKRLAEHIGLVPLIVVSPADQQLIIGSSEERRRFMDIVISQCDPLYLEALVRYGRALQQRNAMLKQEEEPAPELMLLWEESMAREGEFIFQRRKAFVEALTPSFQHYYNCIAQEREQVGLRYTSHCQRGPLLDVISRDRQRDRAVGYSLHGVHRDELEMTLGGYPMKNEGSQGQNKTYLIALKLAQFEMLCHTASHTTPLLLLDDIFDKLDSTRVEQIVKIVAGQEFGQIFITDTNRDHLDKILSCVSGEHRLFHVQQGEITPWKEDTHNC